MVTAHQVSTEWHQSFNSCVVASYALAAKSMGVQQSVDAFFKSFAQYKSLTNLYDLPWEQIVANYFDHPVSDADGNGLRQVEDAHTNSQAPGFADAQKLGIAARWIPSAAHLAKSGLSEESVVCVAYLSLGPNGKGFHCVVIGQDSSGAWIRDPNIANTLKSFSAVSSAIASLGGVLDGLILSLPGPGQSQMGPDLPSQA
jgi:hypothetical protein